MFVTDAKITKPLIGTREDVFSMDLYVGIITKILIILALYEKDARLSNFEML